MGSKSSKSGNENMSESEKDLHLAIMANQRPLVRALIGEDVNVDCSIKGIDVINAKDGITPLIRAVSLNYYDITKMLIEADACVNKPDCNGCTPLFKAAFHGRPKLIDLLLKSGARVNLANKSGQTPLYICVYNSIVHTNQEAVSRLLRASANVDKCDVEGMSPIHVCCQWKRANMLRLLIEAGGDVNIINKFGQIPLYICASAISTRLYDADLALILPCLRVLYAANSDMLNLIEHLKSKGTGIPEHVLYCTYTETDTGQSVERFAVWYRESINSPPSLAHLCRKVIQTRITRDKSFTDRMSKLPLPKTVRKFASRKLFFPKKPCHCQCNELLPIPLTETPSD